MSLQSQNYHLVPIRLKAHGTHTHNIISAISYSVLSTFASTRISTLEHFRHLWYISFLSDILGPETEKCKRCCASHIWKCASCAESEVLARV